MTANKNIIDILGTKLVYVATHTPKLKNGIINAINEYTDQDPVMEKDILKVVTSSKPLEQMVKYIKRSQKDILAYANNVKITGLRQREGDDYHKIYYSGEYAYNNAEYRALLKAKIEYTLFFLAYDLHHTDVHHTTLTAIVDRYLPIPKDIYNKMYSYVEVQASLKPSEWVELGQLMHVYPTKENTIKAICVKALTTMSHSTESRTISTVFNTVKTSKKIEYSTITVVRTEEASWVSTFRQTSRFTIGEEGEILENCVLPELMDIFKLTETERKSTYRALEMIKLMTTTDTLPSYLSKILKIMGNTFLPDALPYLDAEHINNLLAILYAMSLTISKDLSYLIITHTDFLPNNEFIVDDHTTPASMVSNVDKSLVEELNKYFFVPIGDSANRLINVDSDYRVSIETQREIISYTNMKNDMAKLYLSILKRTKSLVK